MSSGDSWINQECQACVGNFSSNLDFSRRYNDNHAKVAELLLLIVQWAVLPCLAAFYLRYHIWSAQGLDAQAKHCLLCAPRPLPPSPPPPLTPSPPHPLRMFLAIGSSFSALDWTLWWHYKYQPLSDPQAVLISVYWFKPLGYTGYVCAKGLCVYRVLRSSAASTPHATRLALHIGRVTRRCSWFCLSPAHKRDSLKRRVTTAITSVIAIALAVSLVAASVASYTLRTAAPDILLLLRSTGAMCGALFAHPCTRVLIT